MNTYPSRCTGFAAVLAHAVAAGIMASSRGSARVAPAPFRNVRLGMAFFVINMSSPYFSVGPTVQPLVEDFGASPSPGGKGHFETGLLISSSVESRTPVPPSRFSFTRDGVHTVHA